MTTFTPGTVISSSEVNANFNALKMAVESNSSQIYRGTWNANTNVPDLSSLGMFSAGEYYIVTFPGTFSSITYNINDWIIFNGTNWEKIPSSATITSVFGRTGIITATEGDYNLDKLSDVDLTTLPVDNDILKYDAATMKWKAGTLNLSETDPSVQSFAKNTLPSCAVGEVLKSNGSNLLCVTDNSGAAFSGTPYRVTVTDTGGNLSVSSVTSTQLAYLSGVTSDVQTQLDAKSNAGSFVDWMIAGPQTILTSRINLGTANRAVVTDGTGIPTASSVTMTELGQLSGVIGPIQNQINMKITQGSVTNPVTANDAANKSYVDSFGQWTKNASNVYLPTGNVGIGIASPTVALDVNGDIKTTGHIKTQFIWTTNAGSASFPNISYQPDSGTGIFYPGNQTIGFSISGNEKMHIGNTGNVGIGTNSPISKLHVIGDINASATVTAVTVTQTSDRRLKSNITTIQSALKKVLSLRGVEFDWIKTGAHDLGVIAQEIEKVFPSLVITNNEGVKSVKYLNLAGVLIESTKELNAKVVTLETENKMLKTYLCEKDPYAPFCK